MIVILLSYKLLNFLIFGTLSFALFNQSANSLVKVNEIPFEMMYFDRPTAVLYQTLRIKVNAIILSYKMLNFLIFGTLSFALFSQSAVSLGIVNGIPFEILYF